MNDINTDAGTAAACLYHTGKGESILPEFFHRLTFFQDRTCRSRNTALQKQLFGKSFVHGDGTSKVSASGINDTQKIKSSLYLSVLSVLSVKSKEYHVCSLAKLQNLRTEKLLSGCLHLFDLRIKASHISSCGIYVVFTIKSGHRIQVLISAVNIHQDRLMASLP